MHIPSCHSASVYDPNDPWNVEDRANDPDDGIDYDEIILATEADVQAGRGRVFTSRQEIHDWLEGLCQQVLRRRSAECAAS